VPLVALPPTGLLLYFPAAGPRSVALLVEHIPDSAADISLCSLAAAESISAPLLPVPPEYAAILDFTDSSQTPLGVIEVVVAASSNYPRFLATYAVFASTSAPWLLGRNLIHALETSVAFAPSVTGVTYTPPLPGNTTAALPFYDPVSVRAADPYTLRPSTAGGAVSVHEMPSAQVYVAEAALSIACAGTDHRVTSIRLAFQPASLATSDLAFGSLTLAHALVEGVVDWSGPAVPVQRTLCRKVTFPVEVSSTNPQASGWHRGAFLGTVMPTAGFTATIAGHRDGSPLPKVASTSLHPTPLASTVTDASATCDSTDSVVADALAHGTFASQGERDAAEACIRRHPWSEDMEQAGLIHGFAHTISVAPTATPTSLRNRPLSREHVEFAEATIVRWLRSGVIVPATSPWSSPILIATNAKGKVRFCLDLRHVNGATIPDRYQLPRVEQILQAVQGARVFSTLDMAEGFLQMALDPVSQPVTAFRGPRHGHYQFTASIFGLRNVPSSFQRMMDTILSAVLWIFVVVYVDDILVFSSSVDEHCTHLSAVRSILDAAGVRLRASKCALFRAQAHYVGLVFDGTSVRLDDAAFASVSNCPPPSGRAQIRTFVGLAERFRHYIDEFGALAAPLYKVMNDHSTAAVNMLPGSAQYQAFVSLRTAISSSPVLGLPRLSEAFYLFFDASLAAISCTVVQPAPGTAVVWRDTDAIDWARSSMRACGFFSHTLHDYELNWSMPFKEAYSLFFFTASKAIQPWIASAPASGGLHHAFVDPTATLALTQKETLDAVRARWGVAISALPLSLHHVAGSSNLADATTRPPFAPSPPSLLAINPLRSAPGWCRVVAIDDLLRTQLVRDELRVQAFKERTLASPPSVAAVTVSPHHSAATSALAALLPPGTTLIMLQLADPTLRPVIDFIQAGRPAGVPNRAALEAAARDHWWDATTGLSYVVPLANPRFLHATQVVPAALQLPLVIRLHADAAYGAHCGELRTAELTRSGFHFSALSRVVHDVCSQCPCQFAKHVRLRRIRALHTVRSIRPFGVLGVDIIPLPSGALVIFADFFTKDILLHYAPPAEPVTTPLLVNAYISTVYPVALTQPDVLVVDAGSVFTSDLLAAFTLALATELRISPAHHQSSNGQVERLIGAFKEMVRANDFDIGADTLAAIPWLLAAWRRLVSATTGFSPYELAYGLKPPLLCDPVIPAGLLPASTLGAKLARLHSMHTLAAARLEAAAQRSDAVPPAGAHSLPVGGIVYRRSPPNPALFAQGALQPPYDGPYEIAAALSDVSYIITRLSVPLPQRPGAAYHLANRDQLRSADHITDYHLNTAPTDVLSHRTLSNGDLVFLLAWPADQHLSVFGWVPLLDARLLSAPLVAQYAAAAGLMLPLPLPPAALPAAGAPGPVQAVAAAPPAAGALVPSAPAGAVFLAAAAPAPPILAVPAVPPAAPAPAFPVPAAAAVPAAAPGQPVPAASAASPPPMAVALPPVPAQDEFEIESILSHRDLPDGTMFFTVRWRGYDASADCEVPDYELMHSASSLYADYMSTLL
jgi:hypothetical protein